MLHTSVSKGGRREGTIMWHPCFNDGMVLHGKHLRYQKELGLKKGDELRGTGDNASCRALLSKLVEACAPPKDMPTISAKMWALAMPTYMALDFGLVDNSEQKV